MKNGKKVKLINRVDETSSYENYLGKIGEIVSGEIRTTSLGEYVKVRFDEGVTLRPYIKNLELVGENIIKKSQLQGGDIVTYRNGKIRIIDIKNKRLVYLNNFSSGAMSFDNYNEDLFDGGKFSEFDIVEVYRPTTKETFKTERKQDVKKMTVAQICAELGYDVEIIKEEN